MRTITLRLNNKIDSSSNYSVETEIIVADDAEAEEAGQDAINFLTAFMSGMGKA